RSIIVVWASRRRRHGMGERPTTSRSSRQAAESRRHAGAPRPFPTARIAASLEAAHSAHHFLRNVPFCSSLNVCPRCVVELVASPRWLRQATRLQKRRRQGFKRVALVHFLLRTWSKAAA